LNEVRGDGRFSAVKDLSSGRDRPSSCRDIYTAARTVAAWHRVLTAEVPGATGRGLAVRALLQAGRSRVPGPMT
jgi:hypothetical protein